MSVKAKETRGGTRWQNVDEEEGSRDLFMRYAGGNPSSQLRHENIQSGSIESRRRYVTEVSHISQGDGFKKARINQLDTLRELRQEYEILRGLPIQDEFLRHSHRERQPSEASLQSISSEFKSNKRNDERSARNTQILTLEKRQLELVIGNSMRKVEELLNNEMEYKKIIHELQLQLDSKNTEDKTEILTKTMKRNESELNERIENLKKEIERLRQNNSIWEEKYDSLNSELQQRIAETRKFKEEKRSIEEQVRLEKDKLLSLEIDMKRVRMESEVLAKDRNTEVARLTGLLELQPQNSFGTTEIRRLEEELKIAKQKYDSLFNDFERFKRNSNEKQKEIKNEKKSGSDQYKLFETLVNHMREDSAHQKRASMDLIASMIAKIEGKQANNKESSRVLDELSNLRNDLSTMKRDREGIENPLIGLAESAADFNAKIRILEQEIADGSVTKENLLKEYETIRSSYEFTKSEYEKLNTENQRLRRLLESNHEQVNEQGDRILRRQLEEAQFEIEKARKEGEFNLGMAKAETESKIQILEGELKRSEMNNSNLRQEIDKMREYYESKIAEKNALLDKTSTEFSVFKSTREESLQQIRTESELKMNQMTKRIADLAELSQKSLNENMRVSILEQELSRLRSSAMRSKAMSDNVDHLWQIKETEYANIQQLICETKMSP